MQVSASKCKQVQRLTYNVRANKNIFQKTKFLILKNYKILFFLTYIKNIIFFEKIFENVCEN